MTRGPSSFKAQVPPSFDRKSNIVVFGVEEQPPGMARHLRTSQNLKVVGALLSQLDSSVSNLSIRDCFRLGRYDANRVRPLLVKMLRVSDVTSILSARRNLSSLAPRVFIKPDLSKEDRLVEQLLLKERRVLIDSGVDRTSIKIRGNTIQRG